MGEQADRYMTAECEISKWRELSRGIDINNIRRQIGRGRKIDELTDRQVVVKCEISKWGGLPRKNRQIKPQEHEEIERSVQVDRQINGLIDREIVAEYEISNWRELSNRYNNIKNLQEVKGLTHDTKLITYDTKHYKTNYLIYE